jgi:ferric-dicitrate binding protein FerR (iron transport regulator)
MDEEILIKFLLGETGSEESEQVKQWIAASAQNKKRFEHIELIWSTSKQLAGSNGMDENAAWERFQSKLASKPVVKRLPFQAHWLKIAAMLSFVVGAWFVYSKYSNSGYTRLVASQEVQTEILPDGSELTLNKNSVVSYASGFKGNQRNVRLEKGEVFFNVKRDTTKPFLIQVDKAQVRVLGTSFNIKRSSTETEVIVASGHVRVKFGTDSVELHKNQEVTITADGKLNVTATTDQLYNYYITKQLVADNTPLWRVVEALNEIYGANIVISDSRIKNLPLNATFKEESLQNILNVICDTFRLKAIKKGDSIILVQ